MSTIEEIAWTRVGGAIVAVVAIAALLYAGLNDRTTIPEDAEIKQEVLSDDPLFDSVIANINKSPNLPDDSMTADVGDWRFEGFWKVRANTLVMHPHSDTVSKEDAVQSNVSQTVQIPEKPNTVKVEAVMAGKSGSSNIPEGECRDAQMVLRVDTESGTTLHNSTIVTQESKQIRVDLTEFEGEEVTLTGGSMYGEGPKECGDWRSEFLAPDTLFIYREFYER